MARRPTGFWLIAALLLGCVTMPAAPANRAELHERARVAVRRHVRQGETPGISYAVVTAKGPSFEHHAGLVDAARDEPMTAATQYMAYSTTKVVTAIVVLRLAERGAVELDAPLSRYYAEHPYGDGVTLRMLLGHLGGVPNPAPLDWFFVEGEPVHRDAALSAVLTRAGDLAAEPGAEYRYSNVGYWLLEKAIEAAAGKPYAEVVREEVFEPLGLESTEVSFELPPPERLATGHMRKWSLMNAVFYVIAPSRYWGEPEGGWSRFQRLQSHGLGYGGLYVTVGAFGRILADLLAEPSTLLAVESKRLLFEEQRTVSGEAVGGTLGWVVGDLEGVRYFGKQGGGIGFRGNVRIYPSLGLGTVFFANTTAVSPGPIDAWSDALDGPFVRFAAER